MVIIYKRDLKGLSRSLRKRMTIPERKLWKMIRRKQISGVQFYRQRPIGSYIVDFFCPSKKLIIEIDGSQHYTEAHERSDNIRDAKLAEMGYRTARFDYRQVLDNLSGVVIRIEELVTDE